MNNPASHPHQSQINGLKASNGSSRKRNYSASSNKPTSVSRFSNKTLHCYEDGPIIMDFDGDFPTPTNFKLPMPESFSSEPVLATVKPMTYTSPYASPYASSYASSNTSSYSSSSYPVPTLTDYRNHSYIPKAV